ncbi:MAG: Gfo/Idh/MocA family oxidoreductase [Planctomycetes bacterium]|nr:Gfo/Idh/MocA family oxidoreductase [Planctomycetota bacterium]
MSNVTSSIDRRQLVRGAGLGALGLGVVALSAKHAAAAPSFALAQAPDGPLLKAGLIGCGGRGSGAAFDFLAAGPNLTITALADLFPDRLNGTREELKRSKAIDVPESRCFVGFDAYKQLLETDVDVVLLATPPHFRPEHFREAVRARKHVFLEKPVAVDAPGARSVMASAKKAAAAGLSVVTGTQRRHQAAYRAAYEQVKAGALGEIVSANCYWNQDQLWFREREAGWTDMEWMIRDWVNWGWLSGDHIVEQHVHNLDVIHWFTGKLPKSAVGFGARHRRVTGDQFDMFSVDYVYEGGMHVHSMCRQITGCASNVSELVVGTKGWTDCRSKIVDHEGKTIWLRDAKDDPSPYAQEHVDLVTAIRTNKPFNEAENTALSSLVAVMGRISAYTGREVTWEEALGSDERLGPATYALGPVDLPRTVPMPGA